ncbi:hypothetical protein DFH06DRAFT_1296356 [Mycena polygramma]|nr:hypothetical protein DFH06DRAFT_1296356 [Mycena polygramma]
MSASGSRIPMAPALPPDLERCIFECTALSRPVSIPKLMRVAWRVKHWVEPLLHRTVVVGIETIDGIPLCEPTEFPRSTNFAHAVRNVMITTSKYENMTTLMHSYPNMENLYLMFHGGFPTVAHGGFNSLKQLYASPRIFLAVVHPANSAGFANLTHLELFPPMTPSRDEPSSEILARWTVLGKLPKLTHLALPSMDIPGICSMVLSDCKSLRALIVFKIQPGPSPTMDRLSNDPRFMMMMVQNYTADWQQGVLTGDDYWARADAFIAKRKTGEIDRSTFFVDERKIKWKTHWAE